MDPLSAVRHLPLLVRWHNPLNVRRGASLTFRCAAASNWSGHNAPREGSTMTTPTGSGGSAPDPGLDVIMSERRQLMNLAYRMLSSLAEAEDALQETYARWYAMTRQQEEAIENPGAWLMTVASRIRASQPPATPTARQASVVRDFKKAWEARDVDALVGLLDPGATAIADTGGLARAQPGPIEGRRAARARLRRSRPHRTRPDDPGTHRQRTARPGRPARRPHHGRGRVRGRRRPDQAHLGRTQPRETPALDNRLTAFPARHITQTHNGVIGAPPAARSARTSRAPSRRLTDVGRPASRW